jgi:hypothetical protein
MVSIKNKEARDIFSLRKRFLGAQNSVGGAQRLALKDIIAAFSHASDYFIAIVANDDRRVRAGIRGPVQEMLDDRFAAHARKRFRMFAAHARRLTSRQNKNVKHNEFDKESDRTTSL